MKDQENKIKELSGIIEFGRINESKVVKYK